MKRRLIAALLVTAMTMTMAAGCGNSDSGDSGDSGKDKAKTENDAEENSDADSDTGYSDRKVTLVTSGSGEPYTLLADDGTWTGIDAEMWAEIEEQHGN